MGSFDRFLADSNNQVLFTRKVAGMTVEVVDVNLAPVVRVADGKRASEFPLEKFGILYSDGDEKFYSEATGEEFPANDLVDMAFEAHLFGSAPTEGGI